MAKIGANEKCPCNSGKKYKKCCRDKKPREHAIYFGADVPFSELKTDGQFVSVRTCAGKWIPTKAVLSRTEYQRESGKPKVTVSVPLIFKNKDILATSDASGSLLNQLIKRCDQSAKDIIKQLENIGSATFGKKTIKLDEIVEPFKI